jgi:adenine-specific DNA-methyltransferase
MPRRDISVDALRHKDKRRNIPTAELEPVMDERDKSPIRLAYERRNRDLDPQLVWRGKDEQDWSDLIVQAPPLYIQEKVHPKVLIDDLLRQSRERREEANPPMPDLFADFNGLPDKEAVTEFYQHDANWSNRMILGDSLSVMASLAEREGLRGKVQCIYIDPPYGIRFNSNFQWSTTSRDVMDGNKDHITREPEQVKAFRDTWRDGIHSYLTYLRDRLTVARDLLADSGSIFVQIGDENVHRIRALMDEVFGPNNFVTEIVVKKKGSQISESLESVNDFVLWYSRRAETLKFRPLFFVREDEEIFEDFPLVELAPSQRVPVADLEAKDGQAYRSNYRAFRQRYPNARVFALHPLKSGGYRRNQSRDFHFQNRVFPIKDGQCWKHTVVEDDDTTPGMIRLGWSDRLFPLRTDVRFVRFASNPSIKRMSNWWDNLGGASAPIYVVQTSPEIVKRCILMGTDPGDLVLDPTCGSGTTAYVAEQWGRRWITIDTSRVALTLARARIMGTRYPYYLLADSPEGQRKEGEVTRTPPKETPTHGDMRQGFVYERAYWNTSGSIANNVEVDVIWEKWQQTLEPLRDHLNSALGKSWDEWQIPRDAGDPWPESATKLWAFAKGDNHPVQTEKAITAINAILGRSYTRNALPDAPRDPWPEEPARLHSEWWAGRVARQNEIDASIAAKAEFEYLFDRPYTDNSRMRVAGPFTVESLSPHRYVPGDLDDSLIHELAEPRAGWRDFGQMVLENLKSAGVQQAHKQDRITFTALTPWPGKFISAEGRYSDGGKERRAAILIGPEFGIVSRPDLVDAAREAADAGFDVVIGCAFNFDARSAELDRIGRIPILKARMNPDLHMAGELKSTGSGNLFVVFGEPDIAIEPVDDKQIRVKIKGVDVFKPQTGEIESGGPDTIALWFIDTDYNEESFFVRHAYFLRAATDPYKALRTTLRAEIDEEAWESLRSAISRPFPKPKTGRIAVKVINHLGDEVMKVLTVA